MIINNKKNDNDNGKSNGNYNGNDNDNDNDNGDNNDNDNRGYSLEEAVTGKSSTNVVRNDVMQASVQSSVLTFSTLRLAQVAPQRLYKAMVEVNISPQKPARVFANTTKDTKPSPPTNGGVGRLDTKRNCFRYLVCFT